MGLAVKFIKSYPRPNNYDVEATVCSYSVERKNGIVQIWSGLLSSINPITARNLGETALSGLKEPLGTYYKDHNWTVDKTIEVVDYKAIYTARKIVKP